MKSPSELEETALHNLTMRTLTEGNHSGH